MTQKLLLSSFIVSFGILLGRLMGFIREASIASTFGVSAEADIVVLSLTIPDVLVSMLVTGGLSAALIPEFKSLTSEKAFALFVQISMVMGTMFTLVTIALGFISNIVVYLFAPGLSGQVVFTAQNIISNVLWVIPLTVMAGVTSAYLQSKEKFLMPALGTVINNSCIVAGLIICAKADFGNLNQLVYFILLGGLIRWISQLCAMFNDICLAGVFTACLLNKPLICRYCHAIAAVGVLSLYPVVARSFASFSGEGAVAMMNYAWRLVAFPLGLVVTVLSVVLFPKLSEMYLQRNSTGFVDTLREGMTGSLVMAMAIVGPVLVSPETFVVTVFGWGNNLNYKEMEMISNMLQVMILILPFQAIIAMCIAAFNSRQQHKIPMKVSCFGFVLLLSVCWEGQIELGLQGVVIAVLFCYILVSIILLYILATKTKDLLRINMLTLPLLTVAFSTVGAFIVVNMCSFSIVITFFTFICLMGGSMFAILFFMRKHNDVSQYYHVTK